MARQELNQSLLDGMEDIRKITGQTPVFVRPPYWWFNSDTLAQYEIHGLRMILSDVKAYDGVNCGMQVFRRRKFRLQLTNLRSRLTRDRLPVVDGCHPLS